MNDRVLKFHIQIPHEKLVGLYFFHVRVMPLVMPPTLKKLEGHIAFGLSVCVSVCLCVRVLTFER